MKKGVQLRILIVTRTKDRPAFLRRACASVCRQDYRPLSWSVLNDGGSRDAIDAIAQEAKSAGIETHVTHLETSLGRAGAANAGVRAVAADAVLLLDDDDRLLEGAISILAEALQAAPSADVGVAAQVFQVEERTNGEGDWIEHARRIANPERGPVTIVDLAYRNFVPVNGFLYRRSTFDDVGGYDESLPVVEDWDFLLRLIRRGDIGKLDVPVAEYFVRNEIADFDDPVANSVSAGHALHEEYAARLRNRYLRQDLESGRFGLGYLMNPPHRLPMERINALADGMNRAAGRNWFVRRLLGGIRKR